MSFWNGMTWNMTMICRFAVICGYRIFAYENALNIGYVPVWLILNTSCVPVWLILNTSCVSVWLILNTSCVTDSQY